MKTTQDYICQVLKAHRAMLNRYYGIAATIRVNKKQTAEVFTTHQNMIYCICYDHERRLLMKTINDIIDIITTTCKEQVIHTFCSGIQDCIFCGVNVECPHRLYINCLDAIERGYF